MWENINCGDFINCGRLSSLLWVVLNAISYEGQTTKNFLACQVPGGADRLVHQLLDAHVHGVGKLAITVGRHLLLDGLLRLDVDTGRR